MAACVTRRRFVSRSVALPGAIARLASGQTRRPVRDAFDHLLLGVSDLDRGIAWLEQRTAVRAAFGGVHPGRGTRNALVSLGGAHYLEVIAPDPAQHVSRPQFQLSDLAEPRLITFAVRTNDIGQTAAVLHRAGVHATGPTDGSRRTPAGGLLRWRTLTVESGFQSGSCNPIPFFIEWARDSRHPSQDAPPGCAIEELRIEHPRAKELRAALGAMGLEASVTKAAQARIVAGIRTPGGRIELT